MLQSRGAKDLTRYFPELALPPGRYVLDGEIVIDGEGDGQAFGALQQRIHPAASRIERLASEWPASYVAFDLLELDGIDLRARAVRAPPRGARRARGDPPLDARARPRRRAGVARRHRGRRREAPRRALRGGQAHRDGEGQARAHDRLRGDGLPPGHGGGHRRVADPRPLRRGRPAAPGRPHLGVQRRAQARAGRGARAAARPGRAAAASRAAGAPTATSSGWSCAPSSSSRSATTTSATGGSATGRRSCASATDKPPRDCTLDQLLRPGQLRALRARGRDARRLARGLAELGRPRGVGQAGRGVARGELEQPVQRAGGLVHRGRRVAALAQARRDGVEPQLGRVGVVDLVPLQRAATRARRAPPAPSRRRRPCGRARSGCSR